MTSPLLAISDVVKVLESVGLRLTVRQVRHMKVRPSQRGFGPKGGLLYDATDTTLMAVFAVLSDQCKAAGLSKWWARAAVRYLEADLRQACRIGRPRYLAFDAALGTAALQERPTTGALDLKRLSESVAVAVHAHRTAYPEVWTGSAYVDADDLADAVA